MKSSIKLFGVVFIGFTLGVAVTMRVAGSNGVIAGQNHVGRYAILSAIEIVDALRPAIDPGEMATFVAIESVVMEAGKSPSDGRGVIQLHNQLVELTKDMRRTDKVNEKRY